MTEKITEAKAKIVQASGRVRERIAALVCLTSIAGLAMCKLTDPENIIINVIVAISGFMAGRETAKKEEDK